MKVSSTVKEIEMFLKKEKCIINGELNKEKENTVRDIVFFLALNCEFNRELEMEGYEHLMGVNVKLSTCLFANIVTDLQLIDIFANILDTFPLYVQKEFLQEFLVCFKKLDRSLVLSNVTAVLRMVVKQANLVSSNDKMVSI